ncbi:hypothetical protein [Halobacillus karajensis]|uniref:Uncharacterized protein n=1 Tax=Halobacillus karajensis TaxID=195088 RepID=A0A024P2H1_9BACI|nr:hypothetical protein [Halobacillus karajensis]CDQ19994.1 hypothetical protein BN982_02301 [Halobacillus karajensis]CDQ22454.1 hypothetical protein BN983_00662 [Halobacillus karajensis]CDQ28297.1 hypothetical protein BN981_02591 [Halobacillus karajensis]
MYIYRKQARVAIPLLMLVVLLLMIGCSAGSKTTTEEEKGIIETIVNHQFTGPDLELVDLLEDPAHVVKIGTGETSAKEEPTELDLYLKDIYGSYFNEAMYEEYIGTYAMSTHMEAYNNDYSTDVKDVVVEESERTEGAYTFTVQVNYEGRDEGTNYRSDRASEHG